jgi:outer membrane lipoprotein carrier protein
MNRNASVIPVLRLRSAQATAGICLILILQFICGITLNAQTKMSSAEADALKSTVKALSDKTETITSDFIQYKHLDFLEGDVESNGKLAFKSPDMVLWEYKEPSGTSIIFKNESLYVNNNGDKSQMDLGSNQLFKQLNQLIINSIKGDMFDESKFEIAYFKTDGKSEVHFNPKDEQLAEMVKSFHITFNTKGEVQIVKMIEASDDYTQIVFSNRTTNQALPDSIFAQ